MEIKEKTISSVLILLLILTVIADIAGIYSGWQQNSIYIDPDIKKEQVHSNSAIYHGIGIAQLIVWLLTIIAFSIWFYGVYEDLLEFKIEDLKYSPGWAAGGFFVPILNLIRPYQVAQEVWKASCLKQDLKEQIWQKSKKSSMIFWWWLFFVIAHLSGFIAGSVVAFSDMTAGLQTATIILLIGDFAAVVSAILAILMIGQVEVRQNEKYKELKAE